MELIRHAAARGLQPALDPLGHAAGHRRGLRARPRRGNAGPWGSVSTAPTPPRMMPFAAGRGASSARWPCWPTPVGWASASRSTPRSRAATSSKWTPSPNCLRGRASPCGRCSSWFRSAAGWRKNAFGRRNMRPCFERLWQHSRRQPYAVKTTEAPHYRRFVMQQGGDPLAGPRWGRRPRRHGHRGPLGVGDGKGVMFVSHTGEIFPAGFLPLACGRFPAIRLSSLSEPSDVSRPARSRPLQGEVRHLRVSQVCGGSRARAYAVTGDPLETEPDCVYEPKMAT